MSRNNVFKRDADAWNAAGEHAAQHAGMGTGIGVYYDRNSLTMLGNSRLAQMYADSASSKLQRNAFNFLSMGLALSGQRFRVGANLAVSGQRSDQYLSAANVKAALATNSYWLLIEGVVNDISQNGNSVDYWTTYIKPVVQAWTASGRCVILMTETGANNFTTASARGAVHLYNAQIREYARTAPGVVLFDAASIVMSPGSSMTINPAYSGDGTHINLMPGGYALGNAFATLLQQLAPPCDGLVRSVDQVYGNGGIQWFPNPIFTTTTGGSGNGILTGSVPAGITSAAGPGTTAITGSIVAGSYGNALRLAVTTSAAGRVRVQMDLTGVATENPGDVFYANGQFALASGATNFQWGGMQLESNRASVTSLTQDGYCDSTNGTLPSAAYGWVSETERLTIQSGTRGWLTAYINLWFSGAGSATVDVSRIGVWKVPSAY